METNLIMDVEEQPSPINLKRFGVKNAIQTNFGDDYVFQIIPKDLLLIFRFKHWDSTQSPLKSWKLHFLFILLKFQWYSLHGF